MNPMSFRSPSGSWKSGDVVPDQFPAGLRVLVVDDDPTCLLILEKMLKNCLYEVTKCNRAEVALKLLRDNRDGYDVVISDVHMPDMDGFKLLEHVGLEMDLPVIMMSADDSKGVVMKGVTHGACDYLIKPVRMEALKNIWQHVVRKKKHELREKDNHDQQSGSVEDSDRHPRTSDDTDNYSSANEGNNWKSSSKKRKDEDDDGGDERDDTSALKKPRVVWSVELHQQFVTAVNQLGIDKAVPKKILELMNVPGLTRENVASHLQKYRLYLKRLSVGQHQNVYGNPFMSPTDPTFGSISPLSGLDFQTMASSSQLRPQSLATIQAGRAVTNRPGISGGLVDQRNIFSFENPRNKFIENPQQQQQLNNNKQVNLLHGVPTNVNLPMHPQSSQMVQPHQRNQVLNHPVHRHPMIPNMGLGWNGNDIVRAQPYASSSQPSSLNDFSSSQRTDNTTFSLMGNAGMTSTTPNYDLFNSLNQNRNVDWSLQSRGPTFDPPQHSTTNMQTGQTRVDVAPSVLVQPGFSSDQRSGHIRMSQPVNNMNIGQQLTASTADNSSSRIRPERLTDMGFLNNNLFPDQFGHDDHDLLAYLKQPVEGVAQGDSDFVFEGLDLPV